MSRVKRMREGPDPDPTEFQTFGVTGMLLAGAAALGILYGLLKVIGWL